jgi:small subunit ribosomal protein S8
MSFNDPIGDMLTRIRNGQQAKLQTVDVPHSSERVNLLDVLVREGYVRAYSVSDIKQGIKKIVVQLKYVEGVPSIAKIKRVSTPGRRVYNKVDSIQPVQSGLGISILSTSKGIMSDVEARSAGIGGEVLCQVF